MRLKIDILWVCVSALLFASCGGSSPEDVIVSFKDNHFTRKQLAMSMPPNVKGEDSARFAEKAIEQWIMDQAVMDHALQVDEKLAEEIEYKVQDYRAELIKHAYHSRLIRDSMNANIPFSEIQDYYEKNKQNFRGKENLYCYFYICTASDDVQEQADWITSNNYEDILKLREWARQNALDFKVDSNFVGEATISQVSKGYFGDLQQAPKNKLIRWSGVIQGERRRYLFKMIDLIENGASLPLILCRDKIKNLILNERKVALIENADKRILENARTQNYVREK